MTEAWHRRPLITSKMVNSGERVKQTVVAAGMVAHRDGVSVLEVSGISLVLCNNKCAREGRAMTRVIPHADGPLTSCLHVPQSGGRGVDWMVPMMSPWPLGHCGGNCGQCQS